MEKVGIFYGYLEFITAIWYYLWTSGNLVAFWYISHHFGILRREKSGNPGQQQHSSAAKACNVCRRENQSTKMCH
jgi:hypothetical protein